MPIIKKDNKFYNQLENEVKLADLEEQKNGLEFEKENRIEKLREKYDSQISEVNGMIEEIKALQ